MLFLQSKWKMVFSQFLRFYSISAAMVDVRPWDIYSRTALFSNVISHGWKCSGSSGPVCVYIGTTLPYSYGIIWSYFTLIDSGSTEAVCHSPMYLLQELLKCLRTPKASLLHACSRNFDTSLETNNDKLSPQTFLKLDYTLKLQTSRTENLARSSSTWAFIAVLQINTYKHIERKWGQLTINYM